MGGSPPPPPPPPRKWYCRRDAWGNLNDAWWRLYYIDPVTSPSRNYENHSQCVAYYHDGVAKYCSGSAERRNHNVGKGKCKDIGDANALARGYCGVGDRIKTDTTCSTNEIGTQLYDELATKWCKKHKKDNWCRCYNAINGVCELDPAAAGCSTAQMEHDLIVKDLPDSRAGTMARRALEARMHCRGRVCANAGDTYLPEQRPDCALNLDFCVQELNVGGHILDSEINMKCEIEQDAGQQEGEIEQKQIEEAEEPEPPTFLEKNMKLIAAGSTGTFLSSSSCICCLLLMAVLLSSENNST